MGFCVKCGEQIPDGGAFCGACGASAASQKATAAGEASRGAAPATGGAAASAPFAGMSSNIAGLVAYLLGPVTGIFLLVVEPYKSDKFVRFHAFQSIFVSGVYLVVLFAWSGFTSGLIYASFGALWSAVYFVWWMIRLAFLALWLFLMYEAYNNRQFELPVIGPIARKQAG